LGRTLVYFSHQASGHTAAAVVDVVAAAAAFNIGSLSSGLFFPVYCT
jgi:hypothetical protein